jgi:hypothetical protein
VDLKLPQRRMPVGWRTTLEAELSPGLEAMGVSEVRGSFYRFTHRHNDTDMWLATDLGLVIASHRLTEDMAKIGYVPASRDWRFELCPWADVINPEVTIETTNLDRQRIRVRLLIQLPRVDIEADDGLSLLIAAIMKAKA